MNYLVFDFGGTYIKYALMSDTYEILHHDRLKTPNDSKEDLRVALSDIVSKYEMEVEGIAISFPGKIDVYNGYAHTSGSLTFLHDTSLFEMFRTFSDLPLSVENDGKCAALAESILGSLKDVREGVVLVLGTGVGGGIIIDGKLYRGSHFTAGEFSFIHRDYPLGESEKMFGARGSVYALVAYFKALCPEIRDVENGEDVFRYLRLGNIQARTALERYCKDLVLQLINLQFILDPQRIAIGGGISECNELMEEINAQLDAIDDEMKFAFGRPEVVQAHYRSHANLVGALINFHLNSIK